MQTQFSPPNECALIPAMREGKKLNSRHHNDGDDYGLPQAAPTDDTNVVPDYGLPLETLTLSLEASSRSYLTAQGT